MRLCLLQLKQGGDASRWGKYIICSGGAHIHARKCVGPGHLQLVTLWVVRGARIQLDLEGRAAPQCRRIGQLGRKQGHGRQAAQHGDGRGGAPPSIVNSEKRENVLAQPLQAGNMEERACFWWQRGGHRRILLWVPGVDCPGKHDSRERGARRDGRCGGIQHKGVARCDSVGAVGNASRHTPTRSDGRSGAPTKRVGKQQLNNPRAGGASREEGVWPLGEKELRAPHLLRQRSSSSIGDTTQGPLPSNDLAVHIRGQ